jgi:arylsulfatase A-like enzyme
VNGTDILPTFCEIAGVEVPGDRAIDGASILPIFRGKPIEREVPLYWRYDRALGGPKVAMRQEDWKLLGDAGLDKFELYNLEDDIGEIRDLSAREPDRLKKMVSALREVHRQVENDPISKQVEG